MAFIATLQAVRSRIDTALEALEPVAGVIDAMVASGVLGAPGRVPDPAQAPEATTAPAAVLSAPGDAPAPAEPLVPAEPAAPVLELPPRRQAASPAARRSKLPPAERKARAAAAARKKRARIRAARQPAATAPNGRAESVAELAPLPDRPRLLRWGNDGEDPEVAQLLALPDPCP